MNKADEVDDVVTFWMLNDVLFDLSGRQFENVFDKMCDDKGWSEVDLKEWLRCFETFLRENPTFELDKTRATVMDCIRRRRLE